MTLPQIKVDKSPIHKRVTFKPVTHEFDAFLKFQDNLKIQQAFIALFTRHKGPFSVGEGATEIHVKSQLGNLINPETNERSFEYRVSIGDQNKKQASKFNLHISGQFGPTKYVAKGGELKDYTRTFRGTQIKVDCSYYELDDIWAMLNYIFKELKIGRNHLQTYYRDESAITGFARHIRYHEVHEPEVCHIIDEIAMLSKSSGVSEGHDFWNYRNGSAAMRKVNTDTLDILGFDGVWAKEIKTYRAKMFDSFPVSHALHHPKLEISYDSKLSKKMGIESLMMEDYDNIRDELDEVLYNIVTWAGVVTPIQDDYFKGERIECPVDIKKNILTDMVDIHLNKADVAACNTTHNELLFLRAVAEGNRKPSGIAIAMDVSIRTVYRIIQKYCKDGIVKHLTDNVQFTSRIIHEKVQKSIANLNFVLDKPKTIPMEYKEELTRNHPQYFEVKYNPQVMPGWKFRFKVYDGTKGSIDRHTMMEDYEYHLRYHGVMYGQKLPRELNYHRGHWIDFVPHPQPGTVPTPTLVTSKREYNKELKANRANNIFRPILIVPLVSSHPLYLAD